MLNEALFTSKTDQHWTPESLLADVRAFYTGDFFDPCPRGTPSFDGLSVPWPSDIFCNPPYGRAIHLWTEKAVQEYYAGGAYQIVLLVPARTDTTWFQPFLVKYPICFIRGRLKFGEAKNSAPFPSALVYMGPRIEEFSCQFRAWGAIVNG